MVCECENVYEFFLPRDAVHRDRAVLAVVRCLFVCPFVTRVYSIKTAIRLQTNNMTIIVIGLLMTLFY